MSTHNPANYVVCVKCRVPLDRHELPLPTGPTRVLWTHPVHRQESHPAEPVFAHETGGEVVTSCDFCFSCLPKWLYRCASFVIGGYGSEGNWAACTSCHTLLVVRDYAGLVERALATGPDVGSFEPTLRHDLTLLFATFDQHRLGGPVPLD